MKNGLCIILIHEMKEILGDEVAPKDKRNIL